MPHSDDFGLDDDDSAFLIAATQAETSQNDGFEPSPRPSKRRRVSRKLPSNLDGAGDEELEWSEADDEAHSPPNASTVFRSTANGPTQATDLGSDDIEDNPYLPGELEGTLQEVNKACRFKIHVPDQGGKFPDLIVTQTQHDLDQRPEAFRGAVWKKPKPPVPLAFPAKRSDMPDAAAGVRAIANAQARNNIGNYFQSAFTKPSVILVEDDAAMAARLQAEEDAQARRRYAKEHLGTGTQAMFDATQELADLPEDAFSSSSPEKSPCRATVIEISSQPTQSQAPRPGGLRGPQTGLKQLTIFGQPATQDLTASQAAQKRHAWPMANRDEKPTHHKLDEKAMTTWVYPTNLGSIRDYQFNIVSRSLFHNTLVALPTGLGKTFIAATVMLNYYRWATNAQIVFMAPTKPLIAQQMEACYGIVGIPKRDTVLMTGETTPAARADQWLEKRVFFMTPQTVINDLKTGICDPKKFVLLVVDEAHKATGGYAYTEVVQFLRRFNSSFRVLALTATPGSTTEAVQAVIDNLGIARVELRTESSLDIRQYTHEKHTDTQVFDLSAEQELIMGLFAKTLRPLLDKLRGQNAYWSNDPLALTAYGLTQARHKWAQSDAGRKAPMPIKGMMNAAFNVLSSLAHSIGLLKHHGIGPFYSCVLNFQREVESGVQKGKTAANIAQDENFVKMMGMIRTWTNNPEFIGHPKLEYLREIVLNHFLDAGEGRQGSDVPPSATRIMVFASYRDSTEEICRVLKRDEPMIRPHVFVGQAASKGQEGMNQKQQNQIIQDFKAGKYNTLIATSIGEEGLDIGTVDLIVCYDASSSPIRMLQRIGRTGRKRTGKVELLLTKGKEEKDYEKAQDNYAYIQRTIADASKYAYRDDQSPRILPREFKPVPDKRPVEIPVENSQPVDLNEKSRKGKGKTKRPPKKFHLPDNVRTGFVKASKLDSDSEGEGNDAVAVTKQKTAASKKKQTPAVFRKVSIPVMASPEPEVAALPPLEDILLSREQQQELEEKYARTADPNTDGLVRAPDFERFPDRLRELGPTKHISHSRAALVARRAMRAVRAVDLEKCHQLDDMLHMSDLDDAGPATYRLVSPLTKPTTKRPAAPRPIVLVETAPEARSRQPKVKNSVSISSGSETEGRSRPPPAKKSRAKVRRIKVGGVPDPVQSDEESELPLPTRAQVVPKPRGRPRKKQAIQRAPSYGDAAAEGEESSPVRTPAALRIATQIMNGEDLGSRDTSGEEGEEEQPDSDDQAFLARSDEIEIASSSQPLTPAAKKGGRLKKKAKKMVSQLSDVDEGSESDRDMEFGLEEIEEDEDVMEIDAEPVTKGRKRRVVAESDDDE
ncbi:putative helicase, P-loop containing nucleoside triphosphate hydrolase [Septoria linicola]|nr:putative helicase, P-loop containing nucleoside triphosphate hydrolase [Septoria linicola]